jgi:hypothetical protein
MDDAKLTALQSSLQEVRSEVHRALARLDEELSMMNHAQRVVEIEVEKVRNAAYEALAELRHLDRQLRNDTE